MDMQQDMTDDFRAANRAIELHTAALLDFQAACIRYDWKAADKSRGDAEAAMDAYLTNVAAAYKRMESQ